MVTPKDVSYDPSSLGQFNQTPDASSTSSQKPSGRDRKGEGKEGGIWSPESSEIRVNDEDMRGSPGTTTPSDRIESGSRTADTARGRSAWKPPQKGTCESLVIISACKEIFIIIVIVAVIIIIAIIIFLTP